MIRVLSITIITVHHSPFFILLIKEAIMKTIISEKNESCKKAAERIVQLLSEKHEACLAFSAFDLPDAFFEELIELYAAGKADFSKVRFFSVGEFISCDKLSTVLWKKFLSRVNVSRENCFFLKEDSYSDYDEMIASFGGLDMIVLGLGKNSQIAFNEPGTAFASLTHIQRLSDSYRNQFAELFGGAEKVPEKAVTLGIKSITEADSIIVMAFGEEKADALHKMVYARNDPATPAAFLQLPSDVSVYADPAAAGKL